MGKHICRHTKMEFELPGWAEDKADVVEYASVHFGFREACHLVPPKSKSRGASYLRSRLRRIAVVEMGRIRKAAEDDVD